jgi:hypothetical protein
LLFSYGSAIVSSSINTTTNYYSTTTTSNGVGGDCGGVGDGSINIATSSTSGRVRRC